MIFFVLLRRRRYLLTNGTRTEYWVNWTLTCNFPRPHWPNIFEKGFFLKFLSFLKISEDFFKILLIFIYEGCPKSLAQRTLAPKWWTQLTLHESQCIMWSLTNKTYKKFFSKTLCKNVTQRRRRPKNLLKLCYEKVQQVYIKIECLRGNTIPIFTASLRKVCSHDAVNCSTVARWFKLFKEGRRSLPLLTTLQLQLCPCYSIKR